jgi:hypothetical protein
MAKIIMASTLGSLILICFVQATNMASQSPTANRVTIFQVSLQCPAAPQIGCGSAAKPILLELERDPAVQEAWLNRTGTLIAVVWKLESNSQTRRSIKSRLRLAGCCAREQEITEIKGESRAEALKEFESGHQWYRGAEVDRLSEEEAGIIAARVVRRVEVKTTLAKDKAERLRRVLAERLRECFTEGRDQVALSVGQLAGEFLDERQIAILKQAMESGMRSLLNEE